VASIEESLMQWRSLLTIFLVNAVAFLAMGFEKCLHEQQQVPARGCCAVERRFPFAVFGVFYHSSFQELLDLDDFSFFIAIRRSIVQGV